MDRAVGQPLGGWMSRSFFQQVHGRNLVYNCCWEDPRCDRAALELEAQHEVVVISSAGCNTLDYALDEPRHISAVDVNPRQTALLDLKIAGIRQLDHATFFEMFGRGRVPQAEEIYRDALRSELPEPSRAWWDTKIHYFSSSLAWPTFYFRGTSGLYARILGFYLSWQRGAREAVEWMFQEDSIEDRRRAYTEYIHSLLWSDGIRRFLGSEASLSLMGVPRPQRQQIERGYEGGVAKYIEDCIEYVFTRLPIRDNYFWWLYFFGSYTPERCPEYLKPDSFARLKGGLVDRISTHTISLTDFLREGARPVHRFVLLDHMDWLSTWGLPQLREEWQAIADRAAGGARLLWRSAGLEADFVDPLEVRVDGRRARVGELVRYDREKAAALHAADRVHTYGSFYIADWQPA